MARILSLDIQLQTMKSLLQAMSDRVLAGLNIIIQHIENPAPEELIKLVVWDVEVDNIEAAVDEAILQIFATQQPLAYELRFAHACAKIASHLERMGDSVEGLARQLASRNQSSHKQTISNMLKDTKDLFCRSYAAMFEGDLSLIQEIHDLDDKVDAWQRDLYSAARHILYSNPSKLDVENALQLINIANKLEKLADLTCNWAEQIDFAENGRARRKIGKRKHRITFIDNCGGIYASLAASFLHNKVSELVDISVATRTRQSSQTILEFTEALTAEHITPQVFPVGKIETMEWNRTLMVILVGDFELNDSETESIPYKTIRLEWRDVCTEDFLNQKIDSLVSAKNEHIKKNIFPALHLHTEKLTQLIVRTRERTY